MIRGDQQTPEPFQRAPRESQPGDVHAPGPSCVGARVSLLREHFLITVPGILSDAEDAFAWHEEAIRLAWELTAGTLAGEAFDYELGLIRWLPKQRRRIAALVDVLLRWRSRRLDVVVHSNGSHMITQAIGELIRRHLRGELTDRTVPRISSLHLLAPSCEAFSPHAWGWSVHRQILC